MVLIPSSHLVNPTMDGINEWNELRVKNNYNIVINNPHIQMTLFMCVVNGRLKMVSHTLMQRLDQVMTREMANTYSQINLKNLCESLRPTPIAGRLYKLFGDQMNIWPFCGHFLLTPDIFEY